MPLRHLLAHNRTWASQMEAVRPGFFTALSHQQTPRYMWIGCSDSRVPANQITGLEPGEVFVHRNVANVVVPTDLNCLSTIQYAVDVLKVEHLMVVGHYGCGGVQAALNDVRVGLADNWLRHVKDVRDRHGDLLRQLREVHRLDALCELNVIEQVMHVAETTVVQDAWRRGQPIALHGWVYGLKDGLLQDLHMVVRGTDVLDDTYRAAVAEVAARVR
ncbi:MAG: carbonate dehydratase [Hydrogenophaga sp.]|uniref:carbonate dehydratase n=1 Tax=Hydrogenophaga sp. TaxID=1904254 RepID=UPI0027235205|nr:carbonate dehydratase [Hydrogenophaga sp.]MDO9147682.1 carbonate dehydratase [Hydrogenophaga sp.]MDO9507439.1 carbonate dehydratase [Hydrogenophaga sp.]MDP2162810.1 carbonate dehydratase [Hydrogenophaga sp.]MDP3475169.1 carbonate dehydratase [Hydrogenophaga sp.]